MLYSWNQRASVVVMNSAHRHASGLAALASAAALTTSTGCLNGPREPTQEEVCAELEARGSCNEGSAGCVLVNCGNGWDCNYGSPDEHDLPLVWVSTEVLAEVGGWCQDQGGGWIENWCDDTRGETKYDVYVSCYIRHSY